MRNDIILSTTSRIVVNPDCTAQLVVDLDKGDGLDSLIKMSWDVYNKIKEAIKLFTIDGLYLGNYHYDVDRAEVDGKVEVYLTRFNEECADCPYYEDCMGEKPWHFDNPQCEDMKPVAPYQGSYDFMTKDDIYDYSEFTQVERIAIELIWECPNLVKILEVYNGRN